MKNISLSSLSKQLLQVLGQLGRYSVLFFVLLLAGLYAFLIFKIDQATNVQANQDTTAASTPHIDENLVKQLMQLKDNSVGVQALFSESRTNPFQ